MARRHIPYLLPLLACCAATALATRALVLDAVRQDYGQAGAFDDCKHPLTAFAASRPLADGERIGGDALPPELRAAGVQAVYRRGRLVHFVMPPTTVGNDDATPEFVYALDRAGGVTDEILRATDRYTYHVQPLAGTPHWYYWSHN